MSNLESVDEPVIGAPLTLASARSLAAEVHRRRARGHDVISEHEAERRRRRSEHIARVSNSFAVAAREFIIGHAKPKQRRWQQQARMLGFTTELEVIPRGLVDRWRDKPMADIDGDEVYDLIHEVRNHGVPGLGRKHDRPSEARARAMFACLSKMFSWLVQHRRITKNPCAGVHRPDTPRSRDRVLTDSEVVQFWSAAAAERAEFSSALKILLLTGCRLNEVAGMRRSELSDDLAIWTIPGSRTKNHRSHKVPLSPLARDIVVAAIKEDSDFVFTTTGEAPLSGWSRMKRRLDVSMATAEPWRLHDLRRTAATGMAGLGIAPHIIEAALNHVSGAKAGVAGTYNRAEYGPEKKVALERWASHVEGLVSSRATNVVPINRIGA
jgi:integrase